MGLDGRRLTVHGRTLLFNSKNYLNGGFYLDLSVGNGLGVARAKVPTLSTINYFVIIFQVVGVLI